MGHEGGERWDGSTRTHTQGDLARPYPFPLLGLHATSARECVPARACALWGCLHKREVTYCQRRSEVKRPTVLAGEKINDESIRARKQDGSVTGGGKKGASARIRAESGSWSLSDGRAAELQEGRESVFV